MSEVPMHRVTSLVRRRTALGPYSRPEWPYGVGTARCERGTPVWCIIDTNTVVIHAPSSRLYRGTSPKRKRPPPYDPPRTLGIGLL